VFITVKYYGLDHVTTVALYTSTTLRKNLFIALAVGFLLFYAPQSNFM
jgi:hypothetical protein